MLITASETYRVRTTGDWHPNIDQDFVEVRFYVYPPPVLLDRPTRAQQDHYNRYRGKCRWRISVVGGDDTSAARNFDYEEDARAVLGALVSGPCPGPRTLWDLWGFLDD